MVTGGKATACQFSVIARTSLHHHHYQYGLCYCDHRQGYVYSQLCHKLLILKGKKKINQHFLRCASEAKETTKWMRKEACQEASRLCHHQGHHRFRRQIICHLYRLVIVIPNKHWMRRKAPRMLSFVAAIWHDGCSLASPVQRVKRPQVCSKL